MEKWNEKPIQVTCWGSRGSCPAPYGDRLRFGGNTSCYSVEAGAALLILDGGTGLAGLGEQLAYSADVNPIIILLSHLHLDHISGIPFFKPLYQPDRRVIFYGCEERPGGLKAELEAMMGPPYWPVALGTCPAKVEYVGISGGQRLALPNGFEVETVNANHPGSALLYSIMAGRRKIVYGLDCEMDDNTMDRLVRFAQGADLLICDAQYSPEDYESHRGWGHSTWRHGAALAERCGAKRTCFSHFAWEYGDDYLAEMEASLKQAHTGGFFAREQIKIRI